MPTLAEFERSFPFCTSEITKLPVTVKIDDLTNGSRGIGSTRAFRGGLAVNKGRIGQFVLVEISTS